MSTHGSINNMIAGSDPETVPEVGMGATKIGWTDRHPYTVIEVLSPKRIVVQEDHAERIDNNGMSECQQYSFTPNPNGIKYELRKAKNGQWYGPGGMRNGGKFVIGRRGKYHDYSF